jgi:hypothetical protein
MGFFSKTCAKTHLPIVADCVGYSKLNNIVVLYPDGRKIEGSYDGYGRVDGEDLCPNGYDHDLWESLKFVIADSYEGESYKDLGKSHNELAQGYFMSDKFLEHCMVVGSFKTHAEYKKAFKKLADW